MLGKPPKNRDQIVNRMMYPWKNEDFAIRPWDLTISKSGLTISNSYALSWWTNGTPKMDAFWWSQKLWILMDHILMDIGYHDISWYIGCLSAIHPPFRVKNHPHVWSLKFSTSFWEFTPYVFPGLHGWIPINPIKPPFFTAKPPFFVVEPPFFQGCAASCSTSGKRSVVKVGIGRASGKKNAKFIIMT